jgi:hypothetical protein
MPKRTQPTCCKLSWLPDLCRRAVVKHWQEELDAGSVGSLAGNDRNSRNSVSCAIVFGDEGRLLAQDKLRKKQRKQSASLHLATIYSRKALAVLASCRHAATLLQW